MSTPNKRIFRTSLIDALIKGAQPFGLQDHGLGYSEQSRGGLEDDWHRVGRDIAKATEQYASESSIVIKQR